MESGIHAVNKSSLRPANQKPAEQLCARDNDHHNDWSRRSILAGSASAVIAACMPGRLTGRDYGKNAAPVRYPDPDIRVLDDRFKKYKLGNTPIQRIYHSKDLLWTEGPAWNGVGRYLLWSDIPSDRQYRWLEEDGHVSVFRTQRNIRELQEPVQRSPSHIPTSQRLRSRCHPHLEFPACCHNGHLSGSQVSHRYTG